MVGARSKTPIYATVTEAPELYSDGTLGNVFVDATSEALKRGWRILDRGSIMKALYRWGQVLVRLIIIPSRLGVVTTAFD